MEEESRIMATKKRMLVALYLDFILFMVVWGLAEHFLVKEDGLSFWMAVAAFVLIRAATRKVFHSPGSVMLGINRDGSVNRDIYTRENWLTILLGALFMLEGTKQLVRWTQILVPEPFFGFVPEPGLEILINVATGILFVVIGYLFLRLERVGLALGISSVVGTIISCLLSWSLWDRTVAQVVVARRQAQSLPVREEEVETMQAIMPEGIVILAVVFLVAMAFTYKRFTPPNRLQPIADGGD